jgi:hypothetical protein
VPARDDLDVSRATWRTSSHSNDGGACVEVGAAWRTSSRSGPNGGQCVEVAADTGMQVLVRDTKQHGQGQVHRFTAAEWREFTTQIKTGR